MPVISVHTAQDWCSAPDAALESLRDAAMAAWSLGPAALTLLWRPHAAERMIAPANRGARYCLIEIALLAGRSLELKQSLALACIAALARFGVPAADIDICFSERRPADWFVAGRPLS
jgi:phenylpyruvate tautomerase PptA (4-oxalocrotonate tautomerase family)